MALNARDSFDKSYRMILELDWGETQPSVKLSFMNMSREKSSSSGQRSKNKQAGSWLKNERIFLLAGPVRGVGGR
jgi:hypothetical protein